VSCSPTTSSERKTWPSQACGQAPPWCARPPLSPMSIDACLHKHSAPSCIPLCSSEHSLRLPASCMRAHMRRHARVRKHTHTHTFSAEAAPPGLLRCPDRLSRLSLGCLTDACVACWCTCICVWPTDACADF